MTGSDMTLFCCISVPRRIGGGLLACSLLLPFANSPASAAEAHFHHTVVATAGTAAPAGGNYFRFNDLALNSRGEVTFDTLLRGASRTGVFRASAAATTAIALGGSSSSPANLIGAVNVDNPIITSRGDVIFTFNSDLDFTNTIFRSDGVNLVPLVHDGDPAPGGGTLALTPPGLGFNSRGTITFNAFVSGATATQGIFRTDRSGTVAIATDATPLPTGGAITTLAHVPSVNESGEVAFTTEINNGAVNGVFRGDGTQLTTIFESGQTAAGVTFTDFSGPVINGRGEVLVDCNITDASGKPSDALFVGDGKRTFAIALPGQAAPKVGTYTGAFGAIGVLTDRAQVAFTAALTGGTSTIGLFRGDEASTTTIALRGAVAPGTNGATFDRIFNFAMDEDGRVAFMATLMPAIGDTVASNNMGLWIGTSDADLHLVIRTGQLIGENALASFPTFEDLRLVEKAIAWVGTFADGANSIVVSNIDDDRR
jgi:hypothetical protein